MSSFYISSIPLFSYISYYLYCSYFPFSRNDGCNFSFQPRLPLRRRPNSPATASPRKGVRRLEEEITELEMVLQSSDAGSQEKLQSLESANRTLLVAKEQLASETYELTARNKKITKELRESTQQCKQTLAEFTDLHERFSFLAVASFFRYRSHSHFANL